MPRTPTATSTCYFPQQNVLAVGDVVSGQGWPVVDWVTGGWIGGIVGGLQRLLTLADEKTRIVPGRGPVLSLADLKTQADDVWHDLRPADAAAEQGARAGRGGGGAGRPRNSRRRWATPTSSCAASFESLWAYLSPDA